MGLDPAAPQFTCRIELSRSDGVTILVQDAKRKDQRWRRILLGPTGITLTCQDGAVTSVVTQQDGAIEAKVTTDKGSTVVSQDGETIAFTCKNFKVTAEAVTVEASQDGTITTGGRYGVSSKGDATIESSARLTAKSAQQLALSSAAGASVAASGKLALSGAEAELAGQTTLAMRSGGTAELTGMTVALTGKTELSAEAPVTSVGKGKTSVKGNLVEVSGAMVKVG